MASFFNSSKGKKKKKKWVSSEKLAPNRVRKYSKLNVWCKREGVLPPRK